jgi:hypothetical protein
LIGVIKPERDRLNNVITHLPVNKSATIKYSFKGPPRKDPKTGEVTRDRNEEVNYDGWRSTIGSAIGGTAFFKGGRAMVPRLIIFVFGYGAFGALVAYFVALWRRRPQTLANIIPAGVGAAVVFQIVFSIFANVPNLIPASALLVLASGTLLIGACLKATELDGGAGIPDATRLLGASFALPSGPTASPPRAPGG